MVCVMHSLFYLTEISCVPSAAASSSELPPLVSALKASAEENAASFHSLIQIIGAKPFLHDLPELPELDNLFSPEDACSALSLNTSSAT
ncbi:hypothetical protein H5410_035752 [Solanum commersonii]|uniref:Uncharacterized protein n=1 Tax=Solanum commersonii TaxID=4109 RepID=A0A9J5Y4L2_SOLCO|nr:hypothetical protein H5410_035752 [Solanum commersonii]